MTMGIAPVKVIHIHIYIHIKNDFKKARIYFLENRPTPQKANAFLSVYRTKPLVWDFTKLCERCAHSKETVSYLYLEAK